MACPEQRIGSSLRLHSRCGDKSGMYVVDLKPDSFRFVSVLLCSSSKTVNGGGFQAACIPLCKRTDARKEPRPSSFTTIYVRVSDYEISGNLPGCYLHVRTSWFHSDRQVKHSCFNFSPVVFDFCKTNLKGLFFLTRRSNAREALYMFEFWRWISTFFIFSATLRPKLRTKHIHTW